MTARKTDRYDESATRVLVECDWLTTPAGRLLHFAEDFDERTWEHEGAWIGAAECGVRGQFMIPGIFTRMGERRCPRCCDKLGYPHGKGSPKNDDTCQERLAERVRAANNEGPLQEEGTG